VFYTTERLKKIAEEAAKENSIFSLDDRLALINDSIALAKAGLLPISGMFGLIQSFKNEEECKLTQCARTTIKY
jgi:aminopeptidase 2